MDLKQWDVLTHVYMAQSQHSKCFFLALKLLVWRTWNYWLHPKLKKKENTQSLSFSPSLASLYLFEQCLRLGVMSTSSVCLPLQEESLYVFPNCIMYIYQYIMYIPYQYSNNLLCIYKYTHACTYLSFFYLFMLYKYIYIYIYIYIYMNINIYM